MWPSFFVQSQETQGNEHSPYHLPFNLFLKIDTASLLLILGHIKSTKLMNAIIPFAVLLIFWGEVLNPKQQKKYFCDIAIRNFRLTVGKITL